MPPTAAGSQLAWLMSLQAEPSAEEIQDHLEPTASGEVHADLPGEAADTPGLAYGLLAFGTMVRELPGVVTHNEDALLRLELERRGQVLDAVVSVGYQGSGKISAFVLKEHSAVKGSETDRVRQLFDRMAGTYQQLAAQAHYWEHARAWLARVTRDGFTILDVGCGPGHLTASLPASVRVIGCDLAPEMVRLAALARPAGSFQVHDYHQPFPARWPLADVTIAVGCLEFCSDLTQVGRNLTAATKPEGLLLLTVPRATPASPGQQITLPFGQVTVRLWHDAEVEAGLHAAGLEVISHQVGPGFTAPGLGTVEYGYWELKAAPRAHASTA